MGWTELIPEKETCRSNARLSVMVRKGGVYYRLSFYTELAKSLGLTSRCRLMLGDGENAGILAIAPHDGGPYGIAQLKNCYAVTVKAPPGVFAGKRSEGVHVSRNDNGLVLVAMPAWALPGYVPADGEYEVAAEDDTEAAEAEAEPETETELRTVRVGRLAFEVTEQQEALLDYIKLNNAASPADVINIWDDDREAMLKSIRELQGTLALRQVQLVLQAGQYRILKAEAA